ncbi:heme biosynthesis protein [Archaeoglobales archaeon]|nr:MAG: heme biosynthesis protein [Archaeoglobales archaeon]
MIGITKMVTGEATVSKRLTYGDDAKIPEKLVEFSKNLVPIVVWNITLKCNLKCLHCYASTAMIMSELKTEDCLDIIDQLAEIKVPVILFSGGEPLLRQDIYEIVEYATSKKINCVLSTNGTLITPDVAEKIKEAGFVYVGISIDGLEVIHDRFRGLNGSFKKAFEGLINVKDVGILSGIRFTVTRHNIKDVEPVVNLLAENDIPRFCLYHLVPSGRARFEDDITNIERRELIDFLFDKSIEFVDHGYNTEILTVDNPADGVYIYLKLKEMDEDLANSALEFLRYRGGDSSGIRLANIDAFGNLHPNQFWWDYTIGNLREKKFKDLWFGDDELLIKLRNKTKYLRGKCGICRFKDVCGGFRLRALRAGDLWGEDPDCYLEMDEVV